MTIDAEEPDQGSRALIARIAAIFLALEARPSGSSLGQIATMTGLPRTTVHRTVKGLESQGLVTSGRSGVRLGIAITRLAASAHVDIGAVAMPFIEMTGRRTRETVDLSILRGLHALSVYQYASDHELRVVSPIGAAFPVHCTAHGKALLAGLRDDEIVKLLGRRLEARTVHTHTSVDEVIAELRTVRETGLAFDHQEHALGVCGIGVALGSGGSDSYAISIAVPSLRFFDAIESLKSAILQCKAEIEGATQATPARATPDG